MIYLENYSFVKEKLEKLKGLRENVNWEIEELRWEFLCQFNKLFSDWQGELPNLRDMFEKEEIERLLVDSIIDMFKGKGYGEGKTFVDFVLQTDYKNEPDVDAYGKPLLQRATALHYAAKHEYEAPHVRSLFDKLYNKLYNKLHVNYAKVVRDYDKLVRELFNEAHDSFGVKFAEKIDLEKKSFSPEHYDYDILVRKLFDQVYNKFDVNYTDEEGFGHFHVACKYGFEDIVEKFLEHGQDPDCLYAVTGDSPLHVALFAGHKKVVQLLLNGGAEPNLTNKFGWTPLHVICSKKRDGGLARCFFGYVDDVEQTLRVDAQDKLGRTALQLAASNGLVSVTRLLLRRGADPTLVNEEGTSALRIVFEKFHDDALSEMLFEIVDRFDVRDERGDTLLHLALRENKKKVAALLLDVGADTNLHHICEQDDDGSMTTLFFDIADETGRSVEVDALDHLGRTPLHVALQSTESTNFGAIDKKIRSLLKRGADPNVADTNGTTPLHIICRKHCKYNVVNPFFRISEDNQRTVEINVQDDRGETPLNYALMQRQKIVAEFLLRRGADPTIRNNEGLLPLEISLQVKGSKECVELLVDFTKREDWPEQVNTQDKKGKTPLRLAILNYYGADISLANSKGSTPLHVLCQMHTIDLDVLRIFLKICDEQQLSMQVNAQDKVDDAPLHLALHHDHQDMVELLLRNGADPNLADSDRLTPLQIIQRRGWRLAKLFFQVLNETQQTVQINTQDKLGNTLLNLALDSRNEKTAELLLRNGADPNLADAQGLTPLQIIHRRDWRLAKSFFEVLNETRQTVQINAQDKLGNTLLHLALSSSCNDEAELLLRNGADPTLVNEKGETPLHIICKRMYGGFVKMFFKICDEQHLQVQVDAVDKLGRTPLQWAVANLKLDAVDLLLDRGADVTRFAFPTKSYYGAGFYSRYIDYPSDYKLKLASRALAILDSLEDRGYVMNPSDALTIMKFFAKHGLLIDSAEELDNFCHDDPRFANDAIEHMVKPDLTLYELIQLRPEEAAKRLTYRDYHELASARNHRCSIAYSQQLTSCFLHLCEKLSKKFFRSYALVSFMKLTKYQLPLECCEMIIDESFTNKDLFNIFLATADQS